LKIKYVLVGLLLLIVVTYGILGLLIVTLRGRGAPVGPGFTAKEAYPSALAEARAWQPDCELISANASWRGLQPDELVEDEDVSWGFTFFSPSTRSVGIFGVTSHDAERVDSRDASPSTKTIETALWQVDSPQVLTTFLNEGGRELLAQDPGATVSLRLGPGEGDGTMTWSAIGIGSDKANTIAIQVDPASGQILAAGA
jgi:hypothetical protein